MNNKKHSSAADAVYEDDAVIIATPVKETTINSFQNWVDLHNPFAEDLHREQVKNQLSQMAVELSTNCSKLGFTLEEVLLNAIEKGEQKPEATEQN